VLKLNRGFGAMGLHFPNSPDALMRCYEGLPNLSDMVFDYTAPIVQEYIPGDVYDVCLLFNQGKPRAALTQKRLRMHPSKGGFGIENVTTDQPELQGQAIALLEAMQWHGPAQVEFKIDSRDGRTKLMEVNGRFWGTLDLSVQAGVNFPLLACRMAVDGDIDPVFDYQVGLRYIWPFPWRLRALTSLLPLDSNLKTDLWFSDPLPLLAELRYYVERLWHRRFRRHHPRNHGLTPGSQ
jgi:hypothetical protein